MEGQISLWDIVGDEEVKVNGALNLKSMPIRPYEVTLTTGDLRLIVTMIEDYIRGLDIIKANDIQWEAYYRTKYKGMSEKIQKSIDYDYEKVRKKCLSQKESNSDVGDEALSLAIKKAERSADARNS